MLYPRLKQMLEQTLQRMNHSEIKIVGYLPKADPFVLESRHLGLVTPQELQGLKLQMQQAGEIANETLDLEGIREIAERAEVLKRLKVERREKSGLQLQEMKRSAFIIKKIWKSWSRWGVS